MNYYCLYLIFTIEIKFSQCTFGTKNFLMLLSDSYQNIDCTISSSMYKIIDCAKGTILILLFANTYLD